MAFRTTQSKLREQLIFRDGYCLLTDVMYEKCTAAHIVPFSRSEVGFNITAQYSH